VLLKRSKLASVLRVARIFVIGAVTCFSSQGAERANYSFRWSTNFVELCGVAEGTLQKIQAASWQSDEWQKLLAVNSGQSDAKTHLELPPAAGTYCIIDGCIRFQPKFPFEHGVTYRAVCHTSTLPGNSKALADMVSTYIVPVERRESTTVITRVFPSASELPENLLKFYLHFSAPMSRGNIYEHIHLRDEYGKLVELPFLEIDEELWNPEMTRLTLFIDPGRIKRGVRPLEEIGAVFQAGKKYTLIIDQEWRDAEGYPLKQGHTKTFKAGPPRRAALDTTTWKIHPPSANSRRPLLLRFPTALDHALAQRMIQITDSDGHLVRGQTSLAEEERQCSFVPETRWTRGTYRIVVDTALEDLAGNNIGKPFEVDLFEGIERTLRKKSVSIDFEIK
jgi:hypothetical protein